MDTPKVDDVVRAIDAAFSNVALGNGITLHQADAIDGYLSEAEQVGARALDVDTHWQEVPARLIEHFSCQLSFVDGEGFRYYIPAFMRWVVQNYKTSDSFTVDSTIYSLGYAADARNSPVGQALPLFSAAQQQAIAMFLLHMCGANQFADALHAQRALDSYWVRYAS